MSVKLLCQSFGQIVLASSSPRRAQILKQVGFDFIVVPSKIEEIFNGDPPDVQAMALARLKAEDIAQQYRGHLVLAADTIVALNGRILGKPQDASEAIQMLTLLSGNAHDVFTGFCWIRMTPEMSYTGVERTRVHFRDLSREEIRTYVETGTCFDKAGAYGIQDMSALFCDRIEGDFYNVVGLPITRIYRELKNRWR
jgi:septum formation protein